MPEIINPAAYGDAFRTYVIFRNKEAFKFNKSAIGQAITAVKEKVEREQTLGCNCKKCEHLRQYWRLW